MPVMSRRTFLSIAAVSAMLALGGCSAGQGSARSSSDATAGASAESATDDQQTSIAPSSSSAQSIAVAPALAVPASFDIANRRVSLNNGMIMPLNGLGTYSLQGATCVDSVSAALASGVRLIDTAYMYGNEAEVGQAVRMSGVPRGDIFVITKLYPSQFSNAAASIDEALAKMDIGYVDMMLLHHPGTGEVEAYRAMEDAQAAGKIRALGLSCFYENELRGFLPQISVKPALVQNEIHPYYQDTGVIDFIHDQGIAVQAWYPLGGRGHNADLLSDPVLASIAQTHGVSIPQTILRWDLQRGVIVIPGSSNPSHIAEDADIYGFQLSEEEMAQIDALNRNEKHDWY